MNNKEPFKDTKVLSVESVSESNLYERPQQSANALFRFVDKFDYLASFLESFSLPPRYCVENIGYLNIELKKIAYPMLCFCDLNLHKMQSHIKFYGGYGLAFSKEWGIKKGIQPVQYINPESILNKDFSKAFTDSLQAVSHNSLESNSAQNFLLSQMIFYKSLHGLMERSINGKINSLMKNFTDECEWRYIFATFPSQFPIAITEEKFFSIPTWNKAIKLNKKYHLEFDPIDVRYIIIQTEDEFEKLVDIIEKNCLDKNTKHRLISKILIWADLMEDL